MLPTDCGEEESLGMALAAAVFACRQEWPADRLAREAREAELAAEREAGEDAASELGAEEGAVAMDAMDVSPSFERMDVSAAASEG